MVESAWCLAELFVFELLRQYLCMLVVFSLPFLRGKRMHSYAAFLSAPIHFIIMLKKIKRIEDENPDTF